MIINTEQLNGIPEELLLYTFFIRISQNSSLGYFLSTHFKTKYKIDNNKTKTKPEVCAKVPDFGTVAL